MIVLVDIDGTLADISHRVHKYPKDTHDGEQWREFFRGVGADAIIEPVAEIVRGLFLQGHEIIVATARPEYIRYETTTWLKQHGIPCRELWMRVDNDIRSAPDIKRDMIYFLSGEGRMPHLAIDDDPRNIEMFQYFEIKTLALTPAADCHMHSWIHDIHCHCELCFRGGAGPASAGKL